jgi:hypothetical protein
MEAPRFFINTGWKRGADKNINIIFYHPMPFISREK